MRRFYLVGVLIASAFLNSCVTTKPMNMLVQMMPDQEAYFRNEVISQFEKENNVKINVIHYSSTDSIELEIKKRPGTVALVKVPYDKIRTLIRNGLFKDLNSFLTDEEIAKFKSNYLLTSLGTSENKQCLVPRKFETRIMVFCKSKVADAVASWRKQKDVINNELKKYNNYGLPSNYQLEEDPNNWDYFDLFVVGYVWSHTAYDGKISSRIAQRGKRYSGTSLGLVDKVFQLGGDTTSVLTLQGDPVADVFFWEAAFASSGIYNRKMWEEAWAGTGIWQGIATGDVFLSFMTQLDCFFIHGTGRDNLNGYLKNSDDMGVATMPTGCSLNLDVNGLPVRNGSKAITTGGWWWGIPFDAPVPSISYKLATFISSNSIQIQECTRFGMIPVRKEILGDMSMLFGGGWITNIYETSFRQLMNNGRTVIPSNQHFSEISTVYLDAWYDIVVNKNWSEDKNVPSREYIKDLIRSVYSQKAGLLLAGKSE